MTPAAPALAALLALAAPEPDPPRLAVPVIAQAPERCGPAALEMVLRYRGAPDSALVHAGAAYDPALRGALITDLARAAGRAGFAARVAESDRAGLRAALAAGTPPIVLYDVGFGPLRKHHFGVLVGWDAAARRVTLHDGRERPREMSEGSFMKRWRRAGALALLVEERR